MKSAAFLLDLQTCMLPLVTEPNVSLAVVAAACPVFLDPQEPPDEMANQESPVPLVLTDSLVDHQRSVKKLLHHHVDHAHQAHLAHLDLKDHLATPDDLATPVDLVAMVNLAIPDLKDHLAQLVTQVEMATLDNPVPPLNHPPIFPENPADQENQVVKVSQETQVQMADQETMETQDPKDHLEHLATPEKEAEMEIPEPPATLVDKEREVFAQNIALWTAEFSSQTALADKRFTDGTPSTYLAPSLPFDSSAISNTFKFVMLPASQFF